MKLPAVIRSSIRSSICSPMRPSLRASIRPSFRASAVALALCGLCGAAAAQAITPPAGWKAQPPKPAPPRPDAASTTLETYFPPDGGAAALPAGAPRPAVLYVTRVERKATPDRRDAIASGELEEIFAAQRRQGANAKTEASARRADTAAKQLEASLTWRDAGLGVVDTSRVVAAADAQRVVAVTGECLIGAGAPAELAKACEAALATLDPGIPAAARVPLAMAAEPAPVEATAPASASGASGAGAAGNASGAGGAGADDAPSTAGDPAAGPPPPPPRLGEASHVELPPRVIAPAARAEPDRRPLYVGIGLVMLAVLFWWNRRRRERFEAEDRGTGRAPDRGGGDADDEDLHAAADEPAAEADTGADKEKDE